MLAGQKHSPRATGWKCLSCAMWHVKCSCNTWMLRPVSFFFISVYSWFIQRRFHFQKLCLYIVKCWITNWKGVKDRGGSLRWSPVPECALGDLGKYRKLQSENRSPGRDINSGPPEYETGKSIISQICKISNNAFAKIALRYCFHSC
jgi:hypothetical protein